MTTLALTLALILGAADTACTESGRNYADARAVLAVVRTRARRQRRSLWAALWAPHQHAHGCRWPLTWRHLRLGVEFVAGTLRAPAWTERAWFYRGHADPPDVLARWGIPGARPVGVVVHRFYGR
jgi:hypothetical protein